MSFRIKMDAPINNEIRRIACEELDSGLHELDSDSDTHETIHEVRKHCKKLRGLIRLARPAFEKTYKQENNTLREAAGRLSSARDAQAVIETFDKLVDTFDEDLPVTTYDWIRLQLLEQRDKVQQDDTQLQHKLAAFRRDLVAIRARAAHWPLPDKGFATIAGGLCKTYARGREAMGQARKEPTTERFHEWRKRVKYHRYHLELLQGIWKRPMKARRKELHTLSDLLGFEHDLAVLQDQLLANPDRYPPGDELNGFLAIIDERRGTQRRKAFNLGKRLFVEKPKRLRKRLGAYWKAARKAG